MNIENRQHFSSGSEYGCDVKTLTVRPENRLRLTLWLERSPHAHAEGSAWEPHLILDE